MEFLNINIFWNLVWILPLIFILVVISFKKRKKYLTMILGKRHSDPEYVDLSFNKRVLRLWILAIIIAFVVVAAARPYWGFKLLPFSGRGRDILAVMDVSKSMLSKDIQPSRLAHAKRLLKNLIKNTPGDRYGIIAFAGSAFLECPLTIDRTSLMTTLKDINVDSIPVGGTNIERALNIAIKAFKAAAGGYKAVIIITDGDELQGNTSNVINTLKQIKVPLFVVGIGDPSKPGLIQLPAKNGQSEFLRDSKGELVKSRLNEPLLEQLAKATNGIYIRSTAIDPGLNALEQKVSQLIPEKYKNGQLTRPLEKFQIPLLIALFLVFIWLAVGERKRRNNKTSKNKKKNKKHLKTIVLLLSFIIMASNVSQANNSQDQNSLNNQLNIAPSIIPDNISKAPATKGTQKKNVPEVKNTPAAMFNMGVKEQSKSNVKNAQKYYTKAINLASKKENIRSKAYQNMGVLQHAAARKIMMKNPEQSLKLLAKAENLYKEGMRTGTFRKNVAVNQQILLNDRKKAKKIIKQRKEMQKKRNEAKKKTQEALKKQQQAKNAQNKQQKQQKQKEAKQKTQDAQKAIQDYKKSAQQNKSQKDTQDAKGAENDIKNAQKKQQQGKSEKAEENLKKAIKKLSSKGQQQNQQNKQGQQKSQSQKQQQQQSQQKKQMQNKQNQAKQKIKDALDKQREANKSKNKQEQQQKQQEANKKTQEAQKANNDYQNSADQNKSQQDKQRAKQTSQNLKNARNDQQKNEGKKAEQELKKALDNMNKDKGKQQKSPEKLPPQPKAQPKQPKYDNKDIDPKQADALLKLMANDEKPLKAELKKRQKEAYGNTNVDKDW